MGKHNGKARRNGLSVGSALVNKARRDGRSGTAQSYLHTTDVAAGTHMQSIIETNDLAEMMSMAELADRDFTATKERDIVVISTGAAPRVDPVKALAERSALEAEHRHRLCIPRRPPWTAKTTAEQLEEAERSDFLQWRRGLADLESDGRLVLTPFEKNLEVWRQLWRVVERSDAVVQVVDARDPLTYRSEDLEAYCQEAHAAKRCLLLLNKADLLPAALRSAWADYFDAQGLRYAFWSAKAAAEEAKQEEAGNGVERHQADSDDPRAHLLTVAELTALLEHEAAAAVQEAGRLGLVRASRGERLVVGLTGYPNVGKSSTINALFGSKKTAVAATPGKTKHFQTLYITDDLCLCDCPGLVMPQFAHSKAEMVAAGVIPIDRLTDVRAPVLTVAERVSREQLERVYGLKLPKPLAGEPADRPPTPAELLRALAMSRGWVGASAHPDETRAGRRLLKDYVDGKVLACKPPPGASDEVLALVEEVSGRRSDAMVAAAAPRVYTRQGATLERVSEGSEGSSDSEQSEEGEAGEPSDQPGTSSSGAGGLEEGMVLDDADLDLLELLDALPGVQPTPKQRPQRAAHKFHKKATRQKNRPDTAEEGPGYDGKPLPHGKRGGLVRVTS